MFFGSDDPRARRTAHPGAFKGCQAVPVDEAAAVYPAAFDTPQLLQFFSERSVNLATLYLLVLRDYC